MDSLSFRRSCAKFATGVIIAAVQDEEGLPFGMTVNAFTSVSLDPPMVLICVDRATFLLRLFLARKAYGLSVLAETQRDLSVRFSAKNEKNRFAGVDWRPGATGVPLIEGALAHLECAIENVVEAGDHAVLIAHVQRVWVGRDAGAKGDAPLVFFDRAYRSLTTGVDYDPDYRELA